MVRPAAPNKSAVDKPKEKITPADNSIPYHIASCILIASTAMAISPAQHMVGNSRNDAYSTGRGYTLTANKKRKAVTIAPKTPAKPGERFEAAKWFLWLSFVQQIASDLRFPFLWNPSRHCDLYPLPSSKRLWSLWVQILQAEIAW